jgi:hypothetical protein
MNLMQLIDKYTAIEIASNIYSLFFTMMLKLMKSKSLFLKIF